MKNNFNGIPPVNMYARIIFEDKSYDGYIENAALEDDEYLMTFLIKVSKPFTPDKTCEIHVELPSGVKLNLHGETMMYFISLYDSSTEVLGIKIINPPSEYREFIKSLAVAAELPDQDFNEDIIEHGYEPHD
jgi:hypothetical protein